MGGLEGFGGERPLNPLNPPNRGRSSVGHEVGLAMVPWKGWALFGCVATVAARKMLREKETAGWPSHPLCPLGSKME